MPQTRSYGKSFAIFKSKRPGGRRRWQGQQGSNPRPAVLETAALPTELYPYSEPIPARRPYPGRRRSDHVPAAPFLIARRESFKRFLTKMAAFPGRHFLACRSRACSAMPATMPAPVQIALARHLHRLSCRRPLLARCIRDRYSTMLATMPAPTVRPPSRMAKRSFSSMAIGTISSTSTVTLSPGITISVPAGSDTMPVTSVVRK